MTMPARLFQDSDVGVNTCIMVFRAHIPHKDSSQSVFLARWIDDGFVTIPHSGRFDKMVSGQLRGWNGKDNYKTWQRKMIQFLCLMKSKLMMNGWQRLM